MKAFECKDLCFCSGLVSWVVCQPFFSNKSFNVLVWWLGCLFSSIARPFSPGFVFGMRAGTLAYCSACVVAGLVAQTRLDPLLRDACSNAPSARRVSGYCITKILSPVARQAPTKRKHDLQGAHTHTHTHTNKTTMRTIDGQKQYEKQFAF